MVLYFVVRLMSLMLEYTSLLLSCMPGLDMVGEIFNLFFKLSVFFLVVILSCLINVFFYSVGTIYSV